MSDDISVTGEQEDLLEYGGPEGFVRRWLKEIDIVQQSNEQKMFEHNGKDIVSIYKGKQTLENTYRGESIAVMFNILWANIQVLSPTLYCRMPKPVVERRFKDSDPVGRLACLIAERCITYMLSSQQDRFNYAVRAAVMDRLLPGRGVVKVRYDAEFEEHVDENGEPILDGDTPIRIPKPNSEKFVVDYINWMDYYESPARTPYEVRWKADRVFLTRAKLIKEFGDIGQEVNLFISGEGYTKKKQEEDNVEFLKEAEVYQIQDLDSKKYIWVSPGYKKGPLKVLDNPLQLNDFYSFPVPLVATCTTDSNYPTPDYIIYKGLANELEHITERIGSMIDCIRLVGATASHFYNSLSNILKKPDGQLVPIDNWPDFVEKQGFKGVIDWLPFENAVNAIPILLQQQQNLMGQIFEITGIPDIVRGSTDPNETAAAQQEKGRWTSVKIQDSQQDVQRFCRDICCKGGQIIFEPGLFSDETIALMCGVAQMNPDEQQLFYPALELLRNDRLRTFRVDIETDSTIAMDEKAEQASRMEFLSVITGIVQNIQNVVQFKPELLNPIIETALFAANAFRSGRVVAGSWEKALKQVEDAQKQAMENPPAPPPDYQMMQLQIMQQEAQTNALDVQTRAQIAQMEAQVKMQEAQARVQIDQTDAQIRSQVAFAEGQVKQQLAAVEMQTKTQQLQLDDKKIMLDYELGSKKVEIDAAKVYSQEQIDRMDAELKAFQQQFESQYKEKELKLETAKVILEEKEKLLEEARLREEKTSKESTSPPINVNTGPVTIADPKTIKPMKRRARKVVDKETGESYWETEDLEDSPRSKNGGE